MNDQDSVRLPKKWDDDDEARALMETALELMDEINKGRISGEERGWIDAEVVENLLIGQADKERVQPRKNYDMSLVFPPDCVRRKWKLPR